MDETELLKFRNEDRAKVYWSQFDSCTCGALPGNPCTDDTHRKAQQKRHMKFRAHTWRPRKVKSD